MSTRTFQAMGSPCAITLLDLNEAKAQICFELAQKEITRLEHKYSRYRAESLLSMINRNAGLKGFDCDEETAQLIDFALDIHQQSQGLFDITSGAFRKLWDPQNPHLPTPMEMAKAKALVGMEKIHWDGKHLFLPQKHMQIDLGGLVKEYAADRVALLLQGQQANSALINLSGDLRVTGSKPDGQAWLVGIKDPRDTQKVLATIPIHQGALATSGDYERYFEWEGQRYCHLINPKTAWPVQHWQSVSVAAPSCMLAGAMSTTAMLLQERALPFLKNTRLAYFAIDAQRQTYHF